MSIIYCTHFYVDCLPPIPPECCHPEFKLSKYPLTIPSLLVPPSWSQKPKDVESIVGERVELLCQAKGSPEPTITWRMELGEYPAKCICEQNCRTFSKWWTPLSYLIKTAIYTYNSVTTITNRAFDWWGSLYMYCSYRWRIMPLLLRCLQPNSDGSLHLRALARER